MPLDEKALRRPSFADGEPITLADGQAWIVPRPVVTFSMVFGEDGSPDFRKTDLGFGPDYMGHYDRLTSAATGGDVLRAQAALACALLRRNYDLDNAALSSLLPFRVGDVENEAMWRDLIDLATGNAAPKDAPPADF